TGGSPPNVPRVRWQLLRISRQVSDRHYGVHPGVIPSGRLSGPYNPRQLALSPGIRLGPYEILSALGAGGMGEVYRAHDSKLNRDVALKILPDAFARDPDRLARF